MVSLSNHEVRAGQCAGQPESLRLMKATDGGAKPVDRSCAGSQNAPPGWSSAPPSGPGFWAFTGTIRGVLDRKSVV